MKNSKSEITEKILKPANGWFVLFMAIVLYIADIAGIVVAGICMERDGGALNIVFFVLTLLYAFIGWIWFVGLKVMKPNEAVVLTLFGRYIGTLRDEGF